MTVEVATYISDLNLLNPGATDLKAEGDDHLRLIKACVKATFPNINGVVTPTQTVLNNLAAGTFPTVALTGVTTITAAGALTGVTSITAAGAVTGVTALTTSGNAILGSLSTNTLNVGNGDIVKDAAGNVGIGVAPVVKFDIGGAGSLLGMRRASDGSANLYLGSRAGTALSLYNSGGATAEIILGGAATMSLQVGGVEKIGVTAAGVSLAAPTDTAGNELGFRGLPTASVTIGAFVATDRGKQVEATGGVTIPNATMTARDVVTINNTTASAITITATITTCRLAGTALTGNRTLAGYGVATIIFDSPTACKISGPGLS